MQTWFRVQTTVELAVEQGQASALAPVQARRLAHAARESVGQLSTRRDQEVAEALSRVLDAVEVLEREVELVWRQQRLASRSLVLETTQVHIGGDGLRLERALEAGPWTVHLGVVVQGAYRLLTLDATARPVPGGTELLWREPDATSQDAVVALVFELQRKERRRVRDAV
jgi:hypothetical protein